MQRFVALASGIPLALALLCLVTACGTREGNLTPGAKTALSTPLVGHIGQVITVPGWNITVASTMLRPALHSEATALWVIVGMQNTSSAVHDPTDIGWTLRDAGGTLLEKDTENWPLLEPTPPGLWTTGHIAWVVAGSGSYTLTATSATVVLATWTLLVQADPPMAAKYPSTPTRSRQ
jgi:hypothetical protein